MRMFGKRCVDRHHEQTRCLVPIALISLKDWILYYAIQSPLLTNACKPQQETKRPKHEKDVNLALAPRHSITKTHLVRWMLASYVRRFCSLTTENKRLLRACKHTAKI